MKIIVEKIEAKISELKRELTDDEKNEIIEKCLKQNFMVKQIYKQKVKAIIMIKEVKKKKLYNYNCKNCGSLFQSKYKDRQYCSRKCICAEMSKNKIKDYGELIGKRFGRLVVVKREIKRGRHPYLLCKCDCGKNVAVNVDHLLSGKTKSCGCLRIQHTFYIDNLINYQMY